MTGCYPAIEGTCPERNQQEGSEAERYHAFGYGACDVPAKMLEKSVGAADLSASDRAFVGDDGAFLQTGTS
jgi:hypothetical protein